MKRFVAFTVCVLVMGGVPALSGAQGWLSGLGPFFGKGGGVCAPGAENGGVPSIYIGYVTDSDGISFSVSLDETLSGTDSIGEVWGLSHLALGASYDIILRKNVGFMLSGWWMIPLLETEMLEQIEPGPGNARRTWDASTYWWWIEGMGAYGMSESLSVLLGFRYDAFQGTFRDPGNARGITTSGRDETTLHANSYIPFLGLQYRASRGLRAYAIGTPLVFGEVQYGQTFNFTGPNGGHRETDAAFDSGYFLELMAEYSWPFTSSLIIGAFAKWTGTRTAFSGTLEQTSSPGPVSHASMQGALTRNVWTVGGSAVLNFSLPFTN